MALFWVPGRGLVDDQEEGANIPEYGSLQLPNGQLIEWGDKGVERLPEYTLPAQFGDTPFQWRPGAHTQEWLPGLSSYNVNYIPQLIEWGEASRAGTLKDYERQQYDEMVQQARAIPTRDWTQLQAGYPGDEGDWSRYLTPSSPDAGAIMLQLDERIRSGQASGQERQLYDTFLRQMQEQNVRASVPQASDRFNPLSNEFFMALGALGGAAGGAGAFGAFAPVAGAAGGAGAAAGAAPSLLGIPTSTLSTLGAIGSYGGMGANILGTVTQQPWLRTLGMALGVGGGLAGGLAGLGNVFSTGIQNVGDVARLAGSAGKLTGALGRATGIQPLQQAARYLGLGSQVGSLGGSVAGLLGAAQGVQEGAAQALSPQDLVTQRGGNMSEWDWLNLDLGSGEGYGTVLAPGWDASGGGSSAWDMFTGWGDPYGPGSSGDVGFSESAGGGGWLNTALGALGSVGGFLGKNASWLGPAVSGLTGLGAGALGANAASDAAALQAAALNRGLDLQTAQWLQQQANQAPWLEAGRAALPQLQQLAGQGQPTLQQWGPLTGRDYALPSTALGWTPGTYAGYTPTETPSAAGYRYTPGQVPGAEGYRYRPGAVPTLSGQELLANDPGVAFRLDRAQRALEASAAARGQALSGPALAALQEQAQDLASQEYGQAWGRASQQAQLREQWAQTASQMGFGQALSEAQLREQLAQQAGAQNWQQALQEAQARAQHAQFGWQAGFQGQQQGQREQQLADETAYNRMLQQNQMTYGRDWAEREALNQRFMQAFDAQRLGQQDQWNRLAALSGLGQTAVGQLGQFGQAYGQQMGSLLGQLGTAQGQAALSGGNSWINALSNLGNSAQGAFGNMAFQNQLGSLLGRLNA